MFLSKCFWGSNKSAEGFNWECIRVQLIVNPTAILIEPLHPFNPTPTHFYLNPRSTLKWDWDFFLKIWNRTFYFFNYIFFGMLAINLRYFSLGFPSFMVFVDSVIVIERGVGGWGPGSRKIAFWKSLSSRFWNKNTFIVSNKRYYILNLIFWEMI